MPRPQNNPDYICGHCGYNFNPANHSQCPNCPKLTQSTKPEDVITELHEDYRQLGKLRKELTQSTKKEADKK